MGLPSSRTEPPRMANSAAVTAALLLSCGMSLILQCEIGITCVERDQVSSVVVKRSGLLEKILQFLSK